MSTYDEEHNIRPETDTNDTNTNTNANNINNRDRRPHPTLSVVLRNFLEDMASGGDPQTTGNHLEAAVGILEDAQVRDSLLDQLGSGQDDVEGLPQEYIDSLERVNKKSLKPDQTCSICTNDFLDDPHPLVVRLPCDGKHKFDLECISPWLSVKGTCPLCRKNLLKNEKVIQIVEDSEEEEEDWQTYG